MTMVPAQTLSKYHQLYCGGYGGSYTEEEYYETAAGLLGGSDLVALSVAHNPMAEDESRTTTTTTNTTSASLNNNNNNEAAASSSKDVGGAEDDASWLQLSIGASPKTNTRRGGEGLVELDLLPPSGSGEGERVISQENTRVPVAATPLAPIFHVPQPLPRQFPPFLFQAAAGSGSSMVVPPPPPPPYHQEINWAFRPTVLNIGTNNSSSSPTSSSNYMPTVMQWRSHFARTPFQLQSGGGVNVAGSSLDFRAIDPPRRPHSGIWFSLQASQNQAKEPFLPQIPKSYLRIRDGRMTVHLLMKYLVNKLRLDSESEVEITCRGQLLLPFLTLQHVRDNIWNPRDTLTLLSDSSTTDHLMVLQYGRIA